MPAKAQVVPVLIVAFPLASFALLKSGLLPTPWLGLPDALLALGLTLGLGVASSAHRQFGLAGLCAACYLMGAWLNPNVTAALMPVLVNLLLARFFQTTLEPGSEPLISRIARIARRETGGLPAELARYTRRLTAIWALSFLALALNSLLLAAFASLETAILFANTLYPILMGLFFVVENLYRFRRYRAYSHTPFFRLMATLARHGWRIAETGANPVGHPEPQRSES
jgi:uncharacterized membrane protein